MEIEYRFQEAFKDNYCAQMRAFCRVLSWLEHLSIILNILLQELLKRILLEDIKCSWSLIVK